MEKKIIVDVEQIFENWVFHHNPSWERIAYGNWRAFVAGITPEAAERLLPPPLRKVREEICSLGFYKLTSISYFAHGCVSECSSRDVSQWEDVQEEAVQGVDVKGDEGLAEVEGMEASTSFYRPQYARAASYGEVASYFDFRESRMNWLHDVAEPSLRLHARIQEDSPGEVPFSSVVSTFNPLPDSSISLHNNEDVEMDGGEEDDALRFAAIEPRKTAEAISESEDVFQHSADPQPESDVTSRRRLKDSLPQAWAEDRRLSAAGSTDAAGSSYSYFKGNPAYSNEESGKIEYERLISLYRSQNPGFDIDGSQETNGPGSKADAGMSIRKCLEGLLKDGGPDGVKPLAYLSVNVLDLDEVRAALAVKGALWVGLNVHDKVVSDYGKYKPWALEKDDTLIVASHVCLATAFTPNYIDTTIGNVHAMITTEYWMGDIKGERLVEEAWLVLWPEDFGKFAKILDPITLLERTLQKTGRMIEYPLEPYLWPSLFRVESAKLNPSRVIKIAEIRSQRGFSTLRDHHINVSYGRLRSTSKGIWGIYKGKFTYLELPNSTSRSGKVRVHRLDEKGRQLEVVLTAEFPDRIRDSTHGKWYICAGKPFFVSYMDGGRIGEGACIFSPCSEEYKSRLPDLAPGLVMRSSPTNLRHASIRGGDCAFSQGAMYFFDSQGVLSDRVQIYRTQFFDEREPNETRTNAFNEISHFAELPRSNETDPDSGFYTIGSDGTYFFIKTKNTRHGRVEIHLPSQNLSYVTPLKESAEYDDTNYFVG